MLQLPLYGVLFQPYAVNGQITPQSNVDFDYSLRQRQGTLWFITGTPKLGGEGGDSHVKINDPNRSICFRTQ